MGCFIVNYYFSTFLNYRHKLCVHTCMHMFVCVCTCVIVYLLSSVVVILGSFHPHTVPFKNWTGQLVKMKVYIY